MNDFLGFLLFLSMISSFISLLYFTSNIVSSSKIFSTKLYLKGSEDPLLFFNHRRDLLGCVASIFWFLLTALLMIFLN